MLYVIYYIVVISLVLVIRVTFFPSGHLAVPEIRVQTLRSRQHVCLRPPNFPSARCLRSVPPILKCFPLAVFKSRCFWISLENFSWTHGLRAASSPGIWELSHSCFWLGFLLSKARSQQGIRSPQRMDPQPRMQTLGVLWSWHPWPICLLPPTIQPSGPCSMQTTRCAVTPRRRNREDNVTPCQDTSAPLWLWT